LAYNATALPVMIASPGDVSEERNLIRAIIHEWNDINSIQRQLVLLPVGWETHSSPDLGGRPQALINKNVLENCDLLVGVFWTRIGTPTGEAESGTAEEIRRHVGSGKPAMVYFSTAPVAPNSFDSAQYSALKDFKDWCKTQGLIEEYDNLSDFSDKFRRQIQIVLRDSQYLKSLLAIGNKDTGLSDVETDELGSTVGRAAEPPIANAISLSIEAQKLLVEASNDPSGRIVSIRYMSGQAIQTNSINFADSSDRRSIARWEAALAQLVDNNLVIPRGQKNEIFEMTAKGFEVADSLQGK
jgi:hypothetical protein